MFDTFFAASIHEIKNRFGLMLNELDGLLAEAGTQPSLQRSVESIRHEAQFIGSELVRVLSVFKSTNGQMKAFIDQQFLDDFLEEVVARHATTARAKQLSIQHECDPDLTGFFDAGIVTVVLDTAIYNAAKVGAEAIVLRAAEGENELLIHIDDNGPGFPASLLDAFTRETRDLGSVDTSSQSTGLGLYFARQLIASHQEDHRHGSVSLGQSPEGGARVTLHLPQ
jgi:signal transduction histidine kinase